MIEEPIQYFAKHQGTYLQILLILLDFQDEIFYMKSFYLVYEKIQQAIRQFENLPIFRIIKKSKLF